MKSGWSILDVATALTIAGYAFFATLAPLWEWDFWAIWGLKGRVFFEHGAIDWSFLERQWNQFCHPDYPLLLPFQYSFAALAAGGWNDRWLGLISVAFALAFVLIVRDLAAREAMPPLASAITLAIAATACIRNVGLADVPLIAYAGASLLMLRRGLLFEDDASLRHGAVLLGLAACTKNEGLALVVAVAAAMAVTGAARKLPRLWPAPALAAPWLIIRAFHRFPTDLASGPLAARLAARVHELGGLARALGAALPRPWLWLAIIGAIVIARDRRRERFVLIAVAIQLAFYLTSYLITPKEVYWHISVSWDRIALHVLAPATFAAAMMLAKMIERGDDSRHAEARPDL